MTERDIILEYKNVTKIFGSEPPAVNNLSLDVRTGETMVLIGPSGCGKTTTLRMTNRLVDLTKGEIHYRGENVMKIDPTTLRRSMGYVIQGIGLFPHMTIAENIATVPHLKGVRGSELQGIVESCLLLMELKPEEYAHKYPRELSGGQQQRVGVARALAGSPDLILMDEPFGALDPIVRETLQDELLRLKDKFSTTILFVTHDIREAIKMGDRVAILRDGVLVQVGDPLTLLSNPANDFVRDFVGSKDILAQFRYVTVADIGLTCNPCVSATERIGVARNKARTLKLDDRGGRFVCVQNSGGALVGCIDIELPLSDDEHIRAESYVPDFAGIHESTSAYDALAAMIASNVSRIPVHDDVGHFIGLFSMAAISAKLWGESDVWKSVHHP